MGLAEVAADQRKEANLCSTYLRFMITRMPETYGDRVAASHPELGHQAEALLAASSAQEMKEAARSGSSPTDGTSRQPLGPSSERAASQDSDKQYSFLAIFTGISGLISFVALACSWHFFPFILAKIFALTAFFAFIVTLSRLHQRRKKGGLNRESILDIASTAILCICLTVTLLDLLSPFSNSAGRSQRAHVIVEVPQPALNGNPLPTVTCPQRISGKAWIPRGYELVIGYRKKHSGIWAFWPQVTRERHLWSSELFIGSKADINSVYILAFEVIPSVVAQSLHNTYDQAHRGANWWNSTELPPYVIASQHEAVRRTAAQRKC
jgi:hypothetical protein